MGDFITKDYPDYDNRANMSYYIYVDGGVPETPMHEAFMQNIQRNTSIIGIVISVVSFLVNILVIYCCSKDSVLSKDIFYGQIVNFSVSNILISVFVIPLTVYYILQPWLLGHVLCKTWIIFDVLLPFTSFVILLILNIDRVLLMSHPNVYSCTFKKCLTQLVILSPWLIAISIVVPLWTSGSLPYTNHPGECVIIITSEAAVVCPLLTYFVPLFVLVILTLRMLLLRLRQQHQGQRTCATDRGTTGEASTTELMENTEMIEMNRQQRKEAKHSQGNSVTVLCVVNFVFVTMWFPYQCISFLLATCSSQTCIPSMELNQVATWLGAASAAVVPTLWFIDTGLLNTLKTFCVVKVRTPQFEQGPPSEETFV